MIKINSRCEFGDYLDFDRIMEGTDSYQLSQTSDRISKPGGAPNTSGSPYRNTYRLHAILCHNGTLNSGHYFCFLRVNNGGANSHDYNNNLTFDDNSWLKFND